MSEWVFELANSSDLSKIGELTQARQRQLTLTLNRGGSASFVLPIDDNLAKLVKEINTCVVIKRKFSSGFIPVWSGYVSGIAEQTPNTLTVSCLGWLQLLEKRFIKTDLNFLNIDAGEIVLSILDTIGQDSSLLPAYYVKRGTIEHTITRTRQYKAHDQVLKIIQDLSDIENGFDMYIDPTERLLNIYIKKLRDQPNLNFEYGINITDVSRSSDTSRMVNKITVLGGPNLFASVADDTASQNQYGLLEEVTTLSDVNDQLILAAYANAEIAIRSQPLRIYNFSLRKSTPNVPDPKLFIDYEIGDKIYLTALKGTIQERRKPVRIFSLSVSIPENGNEQITNVQTTANV